MPTILIKGARWDNGKLLCDHAEEVPSVVRYVDHPVVEKREREMKELKEVLPKPRADYLPD